MQTIKKWQPKQGVYRQFYKNGEIQSIVNYKNGLRHGDSTLFDSNGRIFERSNYENGEIQHRFNYEHVEKLHGVLQTFYKNGTIKSIVNYKNDQLHGLWEQFDENGTIRYRFNYEHDQLYGLFEEFYPRNRKTTQEFVNDIEQENSKRFYIGDYEVTSCPICLETFVDPRILESCGHIFCLECILSADQEIQRCPCCRQEYDELDFQH